MSTAKASSVTELGGRLGVGRATQWWATEREVDMAIKAPDPLPLRLPTEPQLVTIDLRRTAIVVIDMQNDFVTKGGWVDHVGGNYRGGPRRDRAAASRLLPELRKAGVPVIWVNWGNRPDLMNMPPNQIHLYKPHGTGVGLGDPLPSQWRAGADEGFLGGGGGRRTAPEPSDIMVDKYRISGFWDTPLDSILRNLGIRTVLFAGVNTDQCVLHSLTDANFLGYGCIMVDGLLRDLVAGLLHGGDGLERQEVLRLRHRQRRRS